MMNIPYQKIFIGIITLLSSVLLVLSIRDNVTTAIIFHSVVILCAVIYYTIEYLHFKKQSQKQMIPMQSVMKQFFVYITSIKSYLSYVFLFLLTLITIGSLPFDFIQNISILDSIVSFLSKHSILLTIFAIISGGLTFWIHKEEIETSEEQELMQEEQAEKTRSQEFATKYPRINSIPVIRNIIRWMYVEGWMYSIGLLCIVLTSLGFILPQLGNFLTVDEQRWINIGNAVKMVPENFNDSTDPVFIDKSYARSETYWDSYLSRDFKTTYNNANPSATTNFLHLPAYLIKDKVELKTYLTVARGTIIVHNFFILLLLYFLLKKITSKRNAFIFFLTMALLPQFIGYSRIVNHDSIQGLYIVTFIISLIVGLKTNSLKHYIISGIFYALAILTQIKSIFIQPLLLVIPAFFAYSENKTSIITQFFINLQWFFLAVLCTSIIILPAIISYPVLFLNKVLLHKIFEFFIPITIFFITIVIMLKKEIRDNLKEKIKKLEIYIVKILYSLPIILFIYFLLNRQEILILTLERTGLYPSFSEAAIVSYGVIFFSTPLVLIILFFSHHIYMFLNNRDLSVSLLLTTIFWALIPFFVLFSYVSISHTDFGFIPMNDKYIYVIYPILLIGISLEKFKMSNKTFLILVFLIAFSFTSINYTYKPLYIMYNNFFVPNNQLYQKTTWASDTGITTDYINTHFSNTRIYNPRENIDSFLKNGNIAIPWWYPFWKHNPDYIIIEWEKDHQFTKIFDYYRKNKQPVWSIKKNGAILTGIYEFDPNINYEEIIKP